MSSGSKKGGADPIPAEATEIGNPAAYYKHMTGFYPSNAQVWWAYKRPPEPGTEAPPKLYLEVFDPAIRYQIASGNTQAARGHYIFDAFDFNYYDVSHINLPEENRKTDARPSVAAFYAGRAFWGGVNVFGYSTKIYFSQIIEKDAQLQFCYQAQDPTDEDFRDLLPTDGGVIVIPDMAELNHMEVVGQNLVLFASNGIWMIAGSEGTGFRANDYSVMRISSLSTKSHMSFVTVEGSPMWWTQAGIWTLAPNQMGGLQVQSVSDTNIKKFFSEIPEDAKVNAKGAYNPVLKRVQWIFRRAPALTTYDEFKYDSILNLDLETGAFYEYRPSASNHVFIRGIFVNQGYVTRKTEAGVTVSGEEVTVSDVIVTVPGFLRMATDGVFKYVIDYFHEDQGEAVPAPPEAIDWSCNIL